jgi:alcohol dehydrogenase class IV
MNANIRALRARAPESEALPRYETVARVLTGQADAVADDGAAWVRRICEQFEIPPLGSYGIREQDVPLLVENAAQASSMRGNPLPLTPEELTGILTAAR